MAPDPRATARGHAAGAPVLKGGMALERRPAVVGHLWPIAAGSDERALLWQAVAAGLRALHGCCTARWRARGRRVLRWRRMRRARRVERCALRRYVCGHQCTVCVSVRRKNRSAPDFRASQGVYIRYIFGTNTHHTRTTSTDRLTHGSQYHCAHHPKRGYEHVRHTTCAPARPAGYARSRSQECRSVPPLRPLPAHAARSTQLRSPSTEGILTPVHHRRAHKDEALRRREARRAALPVANDAQSARSVGSEQQPPTSHSLVMHVAPRAPHLQKAPHEDGGAAAPTVDEHAAVVPHRSRRSLGRVRRRRDERAAQAKR